jgi:hypothetical protein
MWMWMTRQADRGHVANFKSLRVSIPSMDYSAGSRMRLEQSVRICIPEHVIDGHGFQSQ